MKQVVKCHCLTIPKKVRMDIRITVDDRNAPEFRSTRDDAQSTIITVYPTISIQIIRAAEIDENGKFTKAPWNPNDSLGMTKYNYPIFVTELMGIQQDMKTPELYTYQGKRLELNEAAAAKIRRVFRIGSMTLELSAIVISQPGVDGEDTRVEGIKMKFNNEQSSVSLTLNELDTLVYTLNHLDVDSMGLLMYLNYVNKPGNPTKFDTSISKPVVDIQPLEKTFASPEDDLI